MEVNWITTQAASRLVVTPTSPSPTRAAETTNWRRPCNASQMIGRAFCSTSASARPTRPSLPARALSRSSPPRNTGASSQARARATSTPTSWTRLPQTQTSSRSQT